MVKDLKIDPEELVYMGSAQSSAYYWIGKYKDVPAAYLDSEVSGTYKRTVQYIGTVIMTDTTRKGTYWNWNECDESIPPYDSGAHWTPEGCERLIVALARDAGREYVNDLNHALKKIPQSKRSKDRVEQMIAAVRAIDSKKIELLVGTRVGDYVLEHIEDEIRAKARCHEWDGMNYDKKTKYLISETNKIRMQRVKDSEDSMYAKIKGRSVKH